MEPCFAVIFFILDVRDLAFSTFPQHLYISEPYSIKMIDFNDGDNHAQNLCSSNCDFLGENINLAVHEVTG